MLIVWVVYPRSIPLEEPAAPLGAKRQPLRSDDADHHLTGANRLVDGLPPGSTRDDAVDVQKYVVLVELLAKSVTDPPRGPANVTSSVLTKIRIDSSLPPFSLRRAAVGWVREGTGAT